MAAVDLFFSKIYTICQVGVSIAIVVLAFLFLIRKIFLFS